METAQYMKGFKSFEQLFKKTDLSNTIITVFVKTDNQINTVRRYFVGYTVVPEDILIHNVPITVPRDQIPEYGIEFTPLSFILQNGGFYLYAADNDEEKKEEVKQ